MSIFTLQNPAAVDSYGGGVGTNRRAATLVEMLVVMGVVAALTAILIVSLRGVRSQASGVQNLSNLRATLVDFTAWGMSHDNRLPNVGLPTDAGSDWYYGHDSGEEERQWLYLGQSLAWPLLMERWLGGAREHWHAVAGPYPTDAAGDDGADHASRFVYGDCLLTSPDVWTYPGQNWQIGSLASHFRLNRFDGVAHPSRKGLLVHWHTPGTPRRWQFGMADGSAHLRSPDEARPAATPLGASNSDERGVPVLHTENGVRGADF